MKKVDKQILGSDDKGGGKDLEEDMFHRLLGGKKLWKTMGKLWKNSMISREMNKELYERVVVSAVVYGSEALSLSVEERIKTEVFEKYK